MFVFYVTACMIPLFVKVVYKLSGCFEQESLEKLVQFAYTGDLELTPKLVRYVYVAANKLKVIYFTNST